MVVDHACADVKMCGLWYWWNLSTRTQTRFNATSSLSSICQCRNVTDISMLKVFLLICTKHFFTCVTKGFRLCINGSSHFWDIAQLTGSYLLRFRDSLQAVLSRVKLPIKYSSSTAWLLKMGSIRCAETSLTNNKLCAIPKKTEGLISVHTVVLCRQILCVPSTRT